MAARAGFWETSIEPPESIMIGILILLSGLALLGGAVACWLLGREAPSLVLRSAPMRSDPLEKPLSGADEEGRRLAAFYAYQMAASRIERTSAG
jgi:hypothetical protein